MILVKSNATEVSRRVNGALEVILSQAAIGANTRKTLCLLY